jgi:NTP pyrophosphatase (non-canonical NTP hydrolase)
LRLAEQFNQEPTFNSYQILAGKTDKLSSNDFRQFVYCTTKLAGEAGEFSEKLGKLIRDKGLWNIDPSNWDKDIKIEFAKELSDVLWYLAITSRILGFTFQDIGAINLEKLESRLERGVIGGSGDNR